MRPLAIDRICRIPGKSKHRAVGFAVHVIFGEKRPLAPQRAGFGRTFVNRQVGVGEQDLAAVRAPDRAVGARLGGGIQDGMEVPAFQIEKIILVDGPHGEVDIEVGEPRVLRVRRIGAVLQHPAIIRIPVFFRRGIDGNDGLAAVR
ncbi:hypothetical protein [Pedomonas mirosovicensis]|uniref:hypothetical protein n=1 Tax=Pedomonas mirosovicensis TaxID=2908641 RepID=UPI0021681BC8|nr:hypothetical protein [Pedomonas mirosovicensis]MCH8686473.1 hypothetical protein [Pedomonas mirosovicensis]